MMIVITRVFRNTRRRRQSIIETTRENVHASRRCVGYGLHVGALPSGLGQDTVVRSSSGNRVGRYLCPTHRVTSNGIAMR